LRYTSEGSLSSVASAHVLRDCSVVEIEVWQTGISRSLSKFPFWSKTNC